MAFAALVAEYLTRRHEPNELHPVALLAAPFGVTAAAVAARIAVHRMTGQAIMLAGLVIVSSAVSLWLVSRFRRPYDLDREQLRQALDGSAHRVLGEDVLAVPASDLRPGEEIVVESGQVVPVDGTVLAGQAMVWPWLGAKATVASGEGDSLVAGARIQEGRLRLVVGWAGNDRAWLRLTLDPRRRADLLAVPARVGRLWAERGAPFGAALAALMVYAAGQDLLAIVLVFSASYGALAHAGIAQIGALQVVRSLLSALKRGIAYRTADAFDRAGRVSSVAFCARGTLLLGEPEVASIESLGSQNPMRVLALVAGAQRGATDPIANAIMRAVRARNVRPDGVRSPSPQLGLGVTAVASTGETLVVGSRALMLKERTSIARGEPKVSEQEAMGRTVLLVALGGHLIGLIGMQDGLRPGARAAVQYLLDVGIEPVLLSGDTRDTCETLARALDIEHIRPELLPSECGEQVRRMADGGATVAVVGHGTIDEAALSSADVSVALGSAGTISSEWSVNIASDDVRDAAFAIRVANRGRREARLGLTLTLAPGVIAALAVGFNLASPAVAPVVAVLGTLAALTRFRTLEE
ncbi:HAD-IC family P-type ATPase [Myxococcota bacterium]